VVVNRLPATRAGQYADRPHLRPVLDTLLAALPALGPVTVQARKTGAPATGSSPESG